MSERKATPEEVRAILEPFLEAVRSSSSSSSAPAPASLASPASRAELTRARASSREPSNVNRSSGDGATAHATGAVPVARHAGRSTVPSSSPAPASPRKKQSRSERRRARRAGYVASLEARGARGCRPRDFPDRVQRGVRTCFENRTGTQARRFLERLPRVQRAAVLELARHPGDGRELPASLSHRWSRWIVSCAWMLWALRRRSDRHGKAAVVDGYTQGMFCALFRNPEGAAYSRSRMFATSYRAGVGTCGPMRALRRAGLWHWQQPPLERADPRFVGPPHALADGSSRRFPFSVFWLAAAAAPPE